MPNFGTSAFLKLLCLNERPQRSEIKRRLLPRDGGYDFHASLRARARQYLLEGMDYPTVVASISEIVREPEQRSVRGGLEILRAWRSGHPGRIVSLDQRVFQSARNLFRVRYQPNFGLVEEGRLGKEGTTAIHIWNNARPDLDPRMVYGTLALFPTLYDDVNGPDDFAVLSLPDQRLFRLSDVDDFSGFAERMAYGIEELMLDIIEEMGLPRPDQPHREERS